MMRHMLLAKLHRVRVTACHLDYAGSLTVDTELLDEAGILVHEKVQVVNINNGHRFETYVIPGRPAGREICVNGAAARLCQVNDRIIVIAYALLDAADCATHRPRVLVFDETNTIIDRL